jgi:hypothetical protein
MAVDPMPNRSRIIPMMMELADQKPFGIIDKYNICIRGPSSQAKCAVGIGVH